MDQTPWADVAIFMNVAKPSRGYEVGSSFAVR